MAIRSPASYNAAFWYGSAGKRGGTDVSVHPRSAFDLSLWLSIWPTWRETQMQTMRAHKQPVGIDMLHLMDSGYCRIVTVPGLTARYPAHAIVDFAKNGLQER